MAQHTSITYLDDIDGGKAVETVPFALDGTQYEIDLNAKNAKNLRKALAEFVEAGRRIKPTAATGRTGRGKSTKASSAPSKKQDLAAIRAWADANGIVVAARGRISESIKEQYTAAEGDTATT